MLKRDGIQYLLSLNILQLSSQLLQVQSLPPRFLLSWPTKIYGNNQMSIHNALFKNTSNRIPDNCKVKGSQRHLKAVYRIKPSQCMPEVQTVSIDSAGYFYVSYAFTLELSKGLLGTLARTFANSTVCSRCNVPACIQSRAIGPKIQQTLLNNNSEYSLHGWLFS